ncbi:unnamed protein product, partial [Closterium sp. NIES-53]
MSLEMSVEMLLHTSAAVSRLLLTCAYTCSKTREKVQRCTGDREHLWTAATPCLAPCLPSPPHTHSALPPALTPYLAARTHTLPCHPRSHPALPPALPALPCHPRSHPALPPAFLALPCRPHSLPCLAARTDIMKRRPSAEQLTLSHSPAFDVAPSRWHGLEAAHEVK